MTVSTALDSAGRHRSPATLPGDHVGRPPRNKGTRYPADPPTVEEIVAVMRRVGTDRHGARLRAVIVVLWRGGLRIQEALALTERDLDPRRGSVLVRERCARVPRSASGCSRGRFWVAQERGPQKQADAVAEAPA
jgi:integrase